MSRLTVILAALMLLSLGTTSAQAATPSWSAALCEAGPRDTYPAGRDMDGDGVPDSEDWCASTPAGQHVGSNGCAVQEIYVNCGGAMPPEPAAHVVPTMAPEPVVQMARDEKDSDGDG